MSRVHEALRRAGQLGTAVEPQAAARKSSGTIGSVISAPMVPGMIDSRASMHDLLEQVQVIPYQAMPDSLLVDPRRAGEAPAEEFRTLRTRLNHIQGQQNIHTLVVTSPSPAEGKSFSVRTSRSHRRNWRATTRCWRTSTSAARSSTACSIWTGRRA